MPVRWCRRPYRAPLVLAQVRWNAAELVRPAGASYARGRATVGSIRKRADVAVPGGMFGHQFVVRGECVDGLGIPDREGF